MADYESDVQTADCSGNSLTLTITYGTGVDVGIVTLGGYNLTGDTPVVTLGGASADDSVTAEDTGDVIWAFAFASPSTGTSISVVVTGLDDEDRSTFRVYGVSSADAAEITATGFPATDTDVFANPIDLSLATVTDDLALYACQDYDTTAGTDRHTAGAGETEIIEVYWSAQQIRVSDGFQKATGTTTALTPAVDSGTIEAAVGFVVPTEGAAPSGIVLKPKPIMFEF